MQMVLADRDLPQRRFAASRATFIGSVSNHQTSRLITNARIRDQQASRAFAAELLAPWDYIRSRAGGSAISGYRVEEISSELEVSSAVVRWQAKDNKVRVVDFSSF
jgi:hypothetical protein